VTIKKKHAVLDGDYILGDLHATYRIDGEEKKFVGSMLPQLFDDLTVEEIDSFVRERAKTVPQDAELISLDLYCS
jgi:hypothetical protein